MKSGCEGVGEMPLAPTAIGELPMMMLLADDRGEAMLWRLLSEAVGDCCDCISLTVICFWRMLSSWS